MATRKRMGVLAVALLCGGGFLWRGARLLSASGSARPDATAALHEAAAKNGCLFVVSMPLPQGFQFEPTLAAGGGATVDDVRDALAAASYEMKEITPRTPLD